MFRKRKGKTHSITPPPPHKIQDIGLHHHSISAETYLVSSLPSSPLLSHTSSPLLHHQPTYPITYLTLPALLSRHLSCPITYFCRIASLIPSPVLSNNLSCPITYPISLLSYSVTSPFPSPLLLSPFYFATLSSSPLYPVTISQLPPILIHYFNYAAFGLAIHLPTFNMHRMSTSIHPRPVLLQISPPPLQRSSSVSLRQNNHSKANIFKHVNSML